MPTAGFFKELHRHHVFRVAAAYAVVGWLVIQVVAILFPVLDFPAWLEKVIVVLVLAGFPVALVVAWAFQTPRDELHPSQGARQRSLRIGFAIGTAGVLAALTAGGVWWWLVPASRSERASKEIATQSFATDEPSAQGAMAIDPNSIAILPFGVLGDGTGDSYLGEGISEEILDALSRVAGLEVIGRTSSFRFGNSNLDARAIGRELGARNLLSGNVYRAGKRLRIDVELDDATTGDTLWTQQYDERMENLFALEDTISNAVVTALKVKLGDIDANSLVFEGTADPQAHDLYLQATRLSWHTDEVSLEQALVLFNQAIAEDPNYAAAWAGMARAYINLADMYRAPLAVLPAMRGAAEKAVALNPKLAVGHLQLGYIAMSYELDFATARRELDRAVKLRPSLGEAHATLGLYLLRIARNSAAARRELQRARKLDPLNPWFVRWDAYAAIAQGDKAGAIHLAQRVDRIDPGFAYNGDTVAMVDGAFGQWQACVDRYTQQHVKPSLSSPQLAICQARMGDTAAARSAAARLAADARHRYVDPTYLAAIDAALGDDRRAMAELEQAYHDHSAHMISLWLNPWYRPLHGDPDFQALVARIAAGTRAHEAAASQ